MSHLTASYTGACGERWPGGGPDVAEAPVETLHLARLGAAFFARKLNELCDSELASSTRDTVCNRRHIVAHVNYTARALAQLAAWARTGMSELPADPFARINQEVMSAATLPSWALRNLFHHSTAHVDVEWREVTGANWDVVLRLPGGHPLSVRRSVWMRACSIWLPAIDLNNAASFFELPPALIEVLLTEAVAFWDVTLIEPADGAQVGTDVSAAARSVDLTRSITNFGAGRLQAVYSPAHGSCLLEKSRQRV